MAHFRYEGFDQLGKARRGTVEAGDQNSALVGIRSQGVNPTRVEPIAAPVPRPRPQVAPFAPPPEVEAPLPEAPQRFIPGTSGSRPNPGTSASAMLPRQPLLRCNSRDMALFYRNMASLINAGTGIGAALKSMSTAASNGALRRACAQMAERSMTGTPMSDMMPAFPGVFSPLQNGIVAAGERGGLLVAAFERLANYCERDHELRTMVIGQLAHPGIVAIAALFIPSIVTLVLLGGHAWAVGMVPVIERIVAFILLLVVWHYAKPFVPSENPVKAVWDRVRLQIPVFGRVVRSLATAKFCRSYGALYSAGVGPGEAIRLSAVACGNMAIGTDSVAQISNIEKGSSLTQALRSTNHFPPLSLQMMQIGEQTGDIDTSMDKVADFLEQDAESAIRRAIPLIGILMLLFVAYFLVLPQLKQMVEFISKIYDNAADPDGSSTTPTFGAQ